LTRPPRSRLQLRRRALKFELQSHQAGVAGRRPSLCEGPATRLPTTVRTRVDRPLSPTSKIILRHLTVHRSNRGYLAFAWQQAKQPYTISTLNQAPDGIARGSALTLKLALATAQRIGEVCGIALTELDLNDTAPMWTIPGARAKNDRPNRVPLSPIAVQLVREAIMLSPGSKWLFPSSKRDGPIDPHAPTKAMERARRAIGLSDFRVHDLRRSAATRMAEMGIPPHTISLILNHASARSGTITDKVYVLYSYDKEKRGALSAWGSRLERIISGSDSSNIIPLARSSSEEGL